MSIFGNPGDADEMLARAKASGTQLEGQQRPSQNPDKLREMAKGVPDDQEEAAGFAEEILAYLNEQWNERQFTPEQRIFSIGLATVNLRQHFPDDKGGTAEFDRVAHEAWKYFQSAKETT